MPSEPTEQVKELPLYFCGKVETGFGRGWLIEREMDREEKLTFFLLFQVESL